VGKAQHTGQHPHAVAVVTGPEKNEHRRCARDGTSPAAPQSGTARAKAGEKSCAHAREKAREKSCAKAREKGRGEEAAVWSDLAALTPPLVVCVAFLIGVAMLLRSQMSPKRRAERDERRRSPDQRS
jgi:hypothetical protein